MVFPKLLGQVERLLAGLVEGAAEALLRVPVQPAQIARRLEEAMEEGAVAGVSGLVTPNHFVATLDPASLARFAGAQAAIQRDLERRLARAAAQRGLRALDPFVVELRAAPGHRGRRLTAQASFLGGGAAGGSAAREDTPRGGWPAFGAGQGAATPESTQVMPATPGLGEAAALVAPEEGGERLVTIPPAGITIGRGAENTVTLADRAVSRRHAAVRRRDGAYFIEDLGSTNGVRVNGKLAPTAALRDGDRVQIGETTLVFRARG